MTPKYVEKRRAHYAANKPVIVDKAREYRMRTLYGIEVADYDVMLKAQGGRCAVCHRTTTKRGYRFAVDHDHKTGRVRGLLCCDCNRQIVSVMDKYPGALQRLCEYLKEPR